MSGPQPIPVLSALTARQKVVLIALATVVVNALINPSIERWAEQEGWLRWFVSCLSAISDFFQSEAVIGAVAFTTFLFIGLPILGWLADQLELPLWLRGEGGKKSLVPKEVRLHLLLDERRMHIAVFPMVDLENTSRSPLYLEAVGVIATLNKYPPIFGCKISSPIMQGEVQRLHAGPIENSVVGERLTGTVDGKIAFGYSPKRMVRICDFRFEFDLIAYTAGKLDTGLNDIIYVPQVRTRLEYGRRPKRQEKAIAQAKNA